MNDTTISREGSVRAGYTSRRILAIAVLIGGATLAACEDDPVDVGHDEGDVAGFELRTTGGTTIYRYTGPAGADTLELAHGESIDIEIVWLDADGEVLDLAADEHSWEFEDNSNAMSFTPSTSNPWGGTITTVPLLPGATVFGTFRVFLFHGEGEEFRTDGLVSAVSGD